MSDLISRADAIEALDKRFDDIPMELTTEILLLRNDLRERIPSVEPERKTGRWIRKKVKHYCPRDDWNPDCDCDVIEGSWNQKEGSYYKYEYGFCSECGEHSYSRGDFCPKCGSYNGGLDESTDIS